MSSESKQTTSTHLNMISSGCPSIAQQVLVTGWQRIKSMDTTNVICERSLPLVVHINVTGWQRIKSTHTLARQENDPHDELETNSFASKSSVEPMIVTGW
jgi:hypothetical protein